jgi:hypothetical protein
VKEGTAKKMSAVNSRSFNRMKNKLKRHNQNHTAEIAKYRQVSITSRFAHIFFDLREPFRTDHLTCSMVETET